MQVHLSRLEHMGRTAVHCSSKDQAEMFMDAMWEQYPQLVEPAWTKGETNWDRYYAKKVEMYYLPRIVRDKGEVDFCQSTNLSNHDRSNLTVVEFVDLLAELDLGEFCRSGIDINNLFGMG